MTRVDDMKMAAVLYVGCHYIISADLCFSNLASILWSWCWGGEDQAGQEEGGEEFLNISGQKSEL